MRTVTVRRLMVVMQLCTLLLLPSTSFASNLPVPNCTCTVRANISTSGNVSCSVLDLFGAPVPASIANPRSGVEPSTLVNCCEWIQSFPISGRYPPNACTPATTPYCRYGVYWHYTSSTRKYSPSGGHCQNKGTADTMTNIVLYSVGGCVVALCAFCGVMQYMMAQNKTQRQERQSLVKNEGYNHYDARVHSVQTWVDSEAAQRLVGETLGRFKEVFQSACPEGLVSVDYPDGPKKKRAPSANRCIVKTDKKGDGAIVQRVWGYFPQ